MDLITPSPRTILHDALRRERAAFHEAGHVVCGLVVGDMPIVEVTIDAAGAGLTRRMSPWEDCPDDALPLRVARLVTATYGGYAADRLRGQRGVAHDDLLVASRSAELVLPRGEAERLCARLLGLSHEIVHDAMPLLATVASGLALAGCLSGDEVDGLVGEQADDLGGWYRPAIEAIGREVAR